MAFEYHFSTPKSTHGGARKGSGRKKLGRRGITIRVSEKLLESLGANAAATIRELVEAHYAYLK
jgi:hypothetical protein